MIPIAYPLLREEVCAALNGVLASAQLMQGEGVASFTPVFAAIQADAYTCDPAGLEMLDDLVAQDSRALQRQSPFAHEETRSLPISAEAPVQRYPQTETDVESLATHTERWS